MTLSGKLVYSNFFANQQLILRATVEYDIALDVPLKVFAPLDPAPSRVRGGGARLGIQVRVLIGRRCAFFAEMRPE